MFRTGRRLVYVAKLLASRTPHMRGYGVVQRYCRANYQLIPGLGRKMGRLIFFFFRLLFFFSFCFFFFKTAPSRRDGCKKTHRKIWGPVRVL